MSRYDNLRAHRYVPPKKPESEKRVKRIDVYVTEAVFDEIDNRVAAKGHGWTRSKEVGLMIDRALADEPPAPEKTPLSESDRIREIMRDRNCSAETAKLLAAAESSG